MLDWIKRNGIDSAPAERIGKTLIDDNAAYQIAISFYYEHEKLAIKVSNADIMPSGMEHLQLELGESMRMITACKYVAGTIQMIYGQAYKLAPRKPKGSWNDYEWFTEATKALIENTEDELLKEYLQKLHKSMAISQYKVA